VSAVAAAPAQASVKPATAHCAFPTGTTGAVGTNAHGLPEVYGGTPFNKPSTSQTTCQMASRWLV
jgi:hypothetical protein